MDSLTEKLRDIIELQLKIISWGGKLRVVVSIKI